MRISTEPSLIEPLRKKCSFPSQRNPFRRLPLRTVILLLAAFFSFNAFAGDQPPTGEPSIGDQRLPEGVDQTTGFRMKRYRAPTPPYLPGGKTVDFNFMLAAVGRADLLLIDVYPPKGLGPDPLDGSWRNSEARKSLPGAIWLPEVGRGHLEQDAKDYLARNLKRLTSDDKDRPLVFFCTADCWQGWNAARRAILLGYRRVHWYPEGTDGWLEHNEEVFAVEPVVFLEEGS